MCAKITLVLRHDYPGQACSLAKSLEVIGERWSLLIVRDVMNGNRRFSGIQASLGVARNVLSARLQRLIDEDILERRAYQESPPRHEYFLTEKGLDLWPALIALMGWGDRHSGQPRGPARSCVIHKDCGGRVSDRGICEACGEILNARDAKAVPGPGAAAYEDATSPPSPAAALTHSRRRRSMHVLFDHRVVLGRPAALFIPIRWSSEATRTGIPPSSCALGRGPHLLVVPHPVDMAEDVERPELGVEGEVRSPPSSVRAST